MRDKVLDFIEGHRVLVLGSIVAWVVVCLMLVVRGVNMGRRGVESGEPVTTVSGSLWESEAEETVTQSRYQASLGLEADKESERVQVTEAHTTEEETTSVQTEPTYDVDVKVFDWTAVPERSVNGDSWKKYLGGISLSDVGTFWGTDLTWDDFVGGAKYLVGVEQDADAEEKGDLKSVGWLIKNVDSLAGNDAIKFTNLHVIGSLSDTHVALLCSYDWYSAFGLEDTLVIFEDISGTLDVGMFREGDIFSSTVFVHNIKVERGINGQNVVVVEYNVFEG